MSWTTCMGKNVSCDDGPIDTIFIDPDVAGYGVLAAFLLTGLASVGAMYWAYFHDCVDERSKTHLDYVVLVWVRKFSLFRKASEKEEIICEASRLFSLSKTRKRGENLADPRKDMRTKALQQFVLTLSDQQLVTGFAILIASFALRCSISVLNFEIASSLAWFSSVTHLATLAILRQYFHEHVWMLQIRLVCMIAVLIMLLATIYTAIDYWDLVLPVQCSYANIADGGPSSFGFSAQILAGTWVTAWLQIYLFLVYGNRIVDLTSKEGKGVINLVTWFNNRLRKWMWLENKDSDLSTPLKPYEKAAIKAADKNQQRLLVERFVCQLALLYVLFQELTKSFVWELILATFGFCYGIMQVSVNLWLLPQNYSKPNAGNVLEILDISYGSMAFGQLIPPLLLILPILAALEVYEDYQIEKKKPKAENAGLTPPNETPEGATRSDSHESRAPVQTGISVDPEQTNGDSSRRFPEFESSASRDLVGNSPSTIQSAPATLPALNAASNSADSKSPVSKRGRGQATDQSIGSKQSSDVSLRQDEPEDEPADTERVGEIYDCIGTPRRVIFLIFISYGVAGIFSSILVGLIYVPGWLPYAFTIVWIVWYFWDIEMTFALVFWRAYAPLIGKLRRRTAGSMAEGV